MVLQLEAERRFSPHYPFGVHVFCDETRRGPQANSCDAWRAGVASGADATLVLQDDLIMSQDFLGGVAFLHTLKPLNPITFFMGPGGAPAEAQRRGVHWVRQRGQFQYSQALLMPNTVAQDHLEWCAAQEAARTPEAIKCAHHCDQWQKRYFVARQLWCWSPVPSLVDHRMDMESSLGTPMKLGVWSRNARWFIGADKSWQSIDWERGLKDPVVL